jgi:flavin reductase (DIM6/NTAB) family NADH-FMN oxidoreductase RutF
VNSFASVSLDPPLILVCIDKRSRSVERLSASPFAVNILSAEQRELALLFAGKSPPATSVRWREIGGVPLLAESLAWLVCAPWASHDAGDHIVFIARVVDFGSAASEPLCFFRGAFLDIAPRLNQKEGGT